MIEHIAKRDYLFRGALAELDPDVAELIRHETARQARTIIMVPSEATIPEAVREAVGSAFHNIYAEGYPTEKMRHMDEADILDYNSRLGDYRRYSDDRYYKGTEYANMIEALARRRVAQVFAPEGLSADDLYVNVQPLSGAPANNAVYTALLQPGDTILSMDLIEGGHLSHGAPVNRTGKQYTIISYGVHPETQHLDYERMAQLARAHQPKIIIGGYSSYPVAPDWQKYREIADEVGAILLADVAHFAGLIAAGVYPNPVGIADIVTFTTHKTLNGPRGAVIITRHKKLSSKLDRGVFPGEQGGPHVNGIAGLAVAMKFAQTDQFKQLQQQTVANARRLAARLQARGLRVCYGGVTDSHMISVDLKNIVGGDGTTLSGDMAARILDLVGIVCNRQTIPGDRSALHPSGIRLGVPWVTQRGADEAVIDRLGDIIADVLLACKPFSYTGKNGARAKIDFDLFQNARLAVRDLIDSSLGIDTDVNVDGYPHFAYIDEAYDAGWHGFNIKGKQAEAFLHNVLTSDVLALADGDSQATHLLEADGRVMATGYLYKTDHRDYNLYVEDNVARVAAWLRALSDGFVTFDHHDIYAKLPGPVDVVHLGWVHRPFNAVAAGEGIAQKPSFIGMNGEHFSLAHDALPPFTYEAPTNGTLKHSVLYPIHEQLGAKMGEFAGYAMPLWYDKVLTEHLAVRNSAGIFDVTHMGTFEVRGAGAAEFLDAVTTNDVPRLAVGASHYTFLLDLDGIPFDDLLIYRLGADHFFLVVNASNNDKNWAWLNAVKDGTVRIDPQLPQRRLSQRDIRLRDLRDAASGADCRVDIALQGPESKQLLLRLEASDADRATIKALAWGRIARVTLDGVDVLVSRTGYTGERVAYELYPHPDHAPVLFQKLVDLGAVPCGLAARDSLRIEAGLPLYGHELAGDLRLNPADAGMENFVKLHKPFFVGKAAFIAHEQARDAAIARFRMANKGARPAHQGDPVVDGRGRVVGLVTSCSVDSNGYQLGHVYLKREFHKRNTQLHVFAGSQRVKMRDISHTTLGDRVIVPEPITILRRFPR